MKTQFFYDKQTFVIPTILCLLFISLSVMGQTCSYEVKELSPIPSPSLSPSACLLDGKIYVTGGSPDGEAHGGDYGTTYLFIYNIANNKWSTGKSMPTKRWMHGSVAVNGKIYVLGGGWNIPLNSVEVYDPETNTWESKSPMPTARGSVSVCAIGEKIYAIGGFDTERFYDITEVYDVNSDTWESKSSMGTTRSGFQLEVINGKIYAIGGTDSPFSSHSSVELYDPDKDRWEFVDNLSNRRFGLVSGLVNCSGYKKILAFGGTRSNMKPSDGYVEYYDLNSDSWNLIEPMKIPSQWGASCTLDNNRVFIMGGEDKCCMTFDDATIFDFLHEYDFSISGSNENSPANNNITQIQLHPNPVKEGTNIEFTLRKAGNIKIEIISLQGRVLKIVANDYFQKGSFSVNYDSSHLSDGIYICRLKTEQSLNSVKLIKYQ